MSGPHVLKLYWPCLNRLSSERVLRLASLANFEQLTYVITCYTIVFDTKQTIIIIGQVLARSQSPSKIPKSETQNPEKRYSRMLIGYAILSNKQSVQFLSYVSLVFTI